MPRKPKEVDAPEAVRPVPIPPACLDEVVKGPLSPADVQAVFQSLKQAVIERAMGAEMSHHMELREGETRPDGETNHRSGCTGRTVQTEDGPLLPAVPRDRDGTREPILIPKHAHRFTGFDDKIVSIYARGMTVREIQGFLAVHYGTPGLTRVHQQRHR